jgi:hypothetical protein
MITPLRANPRSKRLFLFVLAWHHAMAIRSFKLDQLFILPVPELVVCWFGGAGAVSFPNEPDCVKNYLSIKSKFVILMQCSLRFDPLP